MQVPAMKAAATQSTFATQASWHWLAVKPESVWSSSPSTNSSAISVHEVVSLTTLPQWKFYYPLLSLETKQKKMWIDTGDATNRVEGYSVNVVRRVVTTLSKEVCYVSKILWARLKLIESLKVLRGNWEEKKHFFFTVLATLPWSSSQEELPKTQRRKK